MCIIVPTYERKNEMIEVKNLSKYYGQKLAVDNISFSIRKGEIVGFLGPNGAGKSTTMNIITGYLSASAGSVTVSGYDILKSPDECKKRIGYLPEFPPLYPDMTVREYLEFVFDLKCSKSKLKKEDHINRVVALVRINHVEKRLIRNLSKGYKQRVGIAQALIGDPEILILDEPTVGLDPKQIIEVRNVIRELGKEKTIILSSHILQEIDSVCEKIIIINNGILMADGSPDEISSMLSSKEEFTITVSGDKEKADGILTNDIENVSEVKFVKETSEGLEYSIISDFEKDARENVFYALAKAKLPIISMKSSTLTLEEIFLKLTGENAVSLVKKTPAPKEKKKSFKETFNDMLGIKKEDR